MEVQDYETEIIAEIMDFWKELADNIELYSPEISKAAKTWEKRARTFYQRFSFYPEVVHWDYLWKDYRSYYIESKEGGGFSYPSECFIFQGLTRAFYEKLANRWKNEPNKSLQSFLDLVWKLSWNILPDLDLDELACLKAAIRSLSDPNVHEKWDRNITIYEYYRNQTKLSSAKLARILYRLYGYGIIDSRTLINFGMIGLVPYLIISKRILESSEEDYAFFRLETAKKTSRFNGLAVPPVAIEMGWLENITDEEDVKKIEEFELGFNLSRLTVSGWPNDPPSIQASPPEADFGQATLDFQKGPIDLWSTDPLYLEAVQALAPRDVKGIHGTIAQERLQELSKNGAIRPVLVFPFIQCPDLLFLYCSGSSAALNKVQVASYHFPYFRILKGSNWILLALKLPSSWVSSSSNNFRAFLSQLSVKDAIIDVHHGAAERYIPFSKLWNPDTRQWVLWES
ncbi:MAG: hypothetical protein ACFFB3_11140 [Candidatus Hodarchaeota archaeon]